MCVPLVCEWLMRIVLLKCFEKSVDWKSALEMQLHLPFTSKFPTEFSHRPIIGPDDDETQSSLVSLTTL